MIRDVIIFVEKYMAPSTVGAVILSAFFYLVRKYIDSKAKRMVWKGAVKHKLSSMIALFVFFIYLFMLMYIAFLSRQPGSRDALRLQLLCIFSKDIWARTYAIENIVLFIPFGFMLPLIFSRCDTFKWCMLVGIISSVAIELIQNVTKRGYSELDDVLNNSIGTMIGYGVLVVVRTIIGTLKKKGC